MNCNEYKKGYCSLNGCGENANSVLIQGGDIIYLCVKCKEKYDRMIFEFTQKAMPEIIAKQNEKNISVSVGYNVDFNRTK